MKVIIAHSLKYDIVAPYKHRNKYVYLDVLGGSGEEAC
jgi:hypothetical protein